MVYNMIVVEYESLIVAFTAQTCKESKSGLKISHGWFYSSKMDSHQQGA
jgi:hypothetical protein